MNATYCQNMLKDQFLLVSRKIRGPCFMYQKDSIHTEMSTFYILLCAHYWLPCFISSFKPYRKYIGTLGRTVYIGGKQYNSRTVYVGGKQYNSTNRLKQSTWCERLVIGL